MLAFDWLEQTDKIGCKFFSKRAPKTFRAPQGGMIDIDHSYIVLLHVDVVGTTPNLRSGFGGSFRWTKDWKK